MGWEMIPCVRFVYDGLRRVEMGVCSAQYTGTELSFAVTRHCDTNPSRIYLQGNLWLHARMFCVCICSTWLDLCLYEGDATMVPANAEGPSFLQPGWRPRIRNARRAPEPHLTSRRGSCLRLIDIPR